MVHAEGIDGKLCLKLTRLIDADLAAQLVIGFDCSRNLSSSLKDGFNDCLAVNGMSDSLTNMDVVERCHALIKGQTHIGTVRFGENLDPIDGFKLRDLIGGKLRGDIDLAASLSQESSILM